jgi:hypothetical protein
MPWSALLYQDPCTIHAWDFVVVVVVFSEKYLDQEGHCLRQILQHVHSSWVALFKGPLSSGQEYVLCCSSVRECKAKTKKIVPMCF